MCCQQMSVMQTGIPANCQHTSLPGSHCKITRHKQGPQMPRVSSLLCSSRVICPKHLKSQKISTACIQTADGIPRPDAIHARQASHTSPATAGEGEHRTFFFSGICHLFLVSDASVFSQDLQEKKSLAVLEILENVPKLS